MNVVIGAKTDPGRRANNEDQLAVVDMRRHRLRADGVLVVADGMGGRSLGEQASAAAVETVQETLVEMLAAKRPEPADTTEAVVSALRKANARVYEMSRADGEGRGMGTTCVVAVVYGPSLTVAHAGDSRAYLLRDGRLERITDDHSYVAEQVRAGTITEAGARESRFRNVITRAIGIEPTVVPDVSQHEIRPGDALLLCTDGLTNVVDGDEIARTLLAAPSPQAAAERLIRLAVQAGGKDNVTAVVARFEAGNRTEQMRPEDLPRLATRERTEQMRLKDLLPSRPGSAADAPAEALGARPAGPKTSRSPALRLPRPRPPVWPGLAGLALVALLALTGSLIHVLDRDGYELRASAPFLVRPAGSGPGAPDAPAADLSRLVYAPPALFFVRPVQGGLLSLDGADGSLTVATQAGQVVRIAAGGTVLAAFPPPGRAAAPILAADGNQHAAADRQGDLYVADAGAHQITKYAPDGAPLGHIPVARPGALAVAPDGTIYVIDDGRLKVVHPLPPGEAAPPPMLPAPTQPLPPLPFSDGRPGVHPLLPPAGG